MSAESPAVMTTAAGLAFDGVAAEYDKSFTNSCIGRAQRDAVWRVLTRTFHSGAHILELNCGTGEDALFLAKHGVSVYSCDASEVMVETAARRLFAESQITNVSFHQLPTEQLAALRSDTRRFDGVLSNFSGLNCVEDLQSVSENLAALVRPGASLVLCFCTRICLVEILYFLFQRQAQKAQRRWRSTIARVGGRSMPVYYPTLSQLRRMFSPHFVLRECRGVGVAIPPSYLESLVSVRPRLFRSLNFLERFLAPLPVLRTVGDHMVLRFERVP
jgi:2-polyprenyl-3-methyl-5-hydroxy-6-metoxy-1,4-benzoquinol methylase